MLGYRSFSMDAGCLRLSSTGWLFFWKYIYVALTKWRRWNINYYGICGLLCYALQIISDCFSNSLETKLKDLLGINGTSLVSKLCHSQSSACSSSSRVRAVSGGGQLHSEHVECLLYCNSINTLQALTLIVASAVCFSLLLFTCLPCFIYYVLVLSLFSSKSKHLQAQIPFHHH